MARTFAADDADTIGRRLAELRSEREAAAIRVCRCDWRADPQAGAYRVDNADCPFHGRPPDAALGYRP